MNEQQIIQIYGEMVQHYGDRLPNFEHEPIQFKAFLRNYLYYKEQRVRSDIIDGNLQ